MNFLSQLYDSKTTCPPSVNLYLKTDPFFSDRLISRSRLPHTLIGEIPNDEESDQVGDVRQRRHNQSSSSDMPASDVAGCPSVFAHSASRRNSGLSDSSHTRHGAAQLYCEEQEQLLPAVEGVKKLSGSVSPCHPPPCGPELCVQHDCRREGCQRVVINVSGLRFETQLRTLDRLPNTLLGNPNKRTRYWDEARQEFFLDRHRPSFQAVLYYYQSGGRLRRPLEVPVDIFLSELQFYELGQVVIDAFKRSEGYIVEAPPLLPTNRVMRQIWMALEYPQSSLVSKVVAVVSIFFIIVSVITFCMETLPAFQESGCIKVAFVDVSGSNATQHLPKFHDPLFLTESCCILWFLVEFVLRLVACPSKPRFLLSAITWIDGASIAPYFLFLTVTLATGLCQSSHGSSFLSVLRVVRVVRILKLSQHSQGLKILGMTLKTSLRELSLFAIFLSISTVIYAASVYYAERDERLSQFSSIPDGFWWAIVTMTTVGYGDFVPVGLLGKILGSFCALSGVLAIALPVPVIVANFNNYYCHYAESKKQKKSGWRQEVAQLLCKCCPRTVTSQTATKKPD